MVEQSHAIVTGCRSGFGGCLGRRCFCLAVLCTDGVGCGGEAGRTAPPRQGQVPPPARAFPPCIRAPPPPYQISPLGCRRRRVKAVPSLHLSLFRIGQLISVGILNEAFHFRHVDPLIMEVRPLSATVLFFLKDNIVKEVYTQLTQA